MERSDEIPLEAMPPEQYNGLDAAIKVASGMPQAQIGSIEIRPIKDLSKHLK